MIRRVFVSDIHMSLGGSLVEDSADPAKVREYDWFDLDEAAQFLLLPAIPAERRYSRSDTSRGYHG